MTRYSALLLLAPLLFCAQNVSAQTPVLESFADLSSWKAGTENNAGAKGRFAKTGATATLVIEQDTPGKDVLEYTKTFNRNLGENNALVVRYKTALGSYFSLRAIVDGQPQQLLSFQEGSGQWREYSAPISGNVLQSVTLSIAEPKANTLAVIAEKLRSEFAWMKLAKVDAPKLNSAPICCKATARWKQPGQATSWGEAGAKAITILKILSTR
jgi:hypothetical protein